MALRSGEEPIRISRDPLVDGTISPYQYGQFIEYLCNLVPGMWAEKLYDGGFEGLSPYRFAFLRQTDFREKPWYPSGAVNCADYTLDPNHPVSGKVSQKIAVTGGAPCTVSISQDGIFIERAQACDFSCYLRQQELHEPVRVRLHRRAKFMRKRNFNPRATGRNTAPAYSQQS